MKRIEYILLLAILLLASCDSDEPKINGNDFPISYGYMQFYTGVSSRAQLATDMKERNFGVLGYKYSATTTWDAAKALATPNIFYNQQVSCDGNGICTYDISSEAGVQLKPWEDNNYAFFAYHPYNGAGIELSESGKTNTPMLTYTYGWLNPQSSDGWYSSNTKTINVCHSNVPVFDLMTAEAIDVNGSGEGRVAFDFKHRLCAIEVLANNYNENEYEYETNADGSFKLDNKGNKIIKTDGNGNKIIKTSARQQISNLTLTLTGLAHSSMTIPLSMIEEEEEEEEEDKHKREYEYGDSIPPGERITFKISEDAVEIPAFNETVDGYGAGIAKSISLHGSKNGGYIMLIPQASSNQDIKGKLNWAELKNFTGNNVSTEFTSTIDFEPGRLYQIYINFVGSGITIALIEAGAWNPLDVTHTFE